MRVDFGRLVRNGLVPLLLALVLAPVAQAQELVVTPVDIGALAGPVEIAKAHTEVAGDDNLEYVHNNFPGSDVASFDWVPGQYESFDWSFDGEFLRLRVGTGPSATTVERFSTDRIGTLFIACQASDPGSSARVYWNIQQSDVPGSIITDGSVSGDVRAVAGGDESDAVQFSGLTFHGFRVYGSIRHVFDAGSPPYADALSCSFVASSVATNDVDGDGVDNFQDNCPTVYNPIPKGAEKQVDTDGDGMGDECDICRTIPDRGKADDFDGDGTPDPCDNCALSVCEERGFPFNRCVNGSQADPDGDEVGGVMLEDGTVLGCDNCPNDSNPGQELGQDGVQGAACQRGDLSRQEVDLDSEPQAAVVSLLESVAAVGAPAAVGDPRFFVISVACGSFDVSAFTTGVQLSSGVTASFAGCLDPLPQPPQDRDPPLSDHQFVEDPTTLTCFDPDKPDCADGLTEDCLDASVLDEASFTFGPDLLPANDPDNVTDDIFYLRMLGAREEVIGPPVICLANEPAVDIGLLKVEGLDEDETIVLTSTGLFGEAVDFFLLEDASVGNVPATQTTTTNLAGDELARITVSPALPALNVDGGGGEPGDGAGLFASQVTLFSDSTLISNLCIGLQASQPVQFPTDVEVGKCGIDPETGETAYTGITRNGDTVQFRRCTDPSVELGATVALSDSADPPVSYVLDANEPSAVGVIANLQPETTYWVMRGDRLTNFDRDSLNALERETYLGIHRFTRLQQAAPLVTFQGCQEILDWIADREAENVIENAEGEFGLPIDPIANVTQIGGYDTSGDIDRDSVANVSDNCTNAPNADQIDEGTAVDTLLPADAIRPDDIGRACQCGDGQKPEDAALPGTVRLQDDLPECQRAAGNDPEMDPDAAARCSTTGGFRVTSADLLVMNQALDPNVPSVGPEVILEQRCQPAVVPPPPPED